MSDPVANCTLELACTVGSLDTAVEALEEGADINANGGAPLFNAVFNRNIDVIRFLLEQGVDVSVLLPLARLKPIADDPDAIVEELIACAPADQNAIDPDAMEEFDEEIRAKGLANPIKSGDWDGLVRFSEKLEKIGAVQARECVDEVLDLLRPAKAFGDAAVFESIKAEKKAIAAISERYNESAENVANLAQAFLMSESDAEKSSDEESDDNPAEVEVEEKAGAGESRESVATA